MAVSIGSLYLDLRASTEGLRKDAAKAVKQMRRVGNDMAKAVGVGAAAAGGALALVIAQTNEKLDALAKTSDKLGVPIEKLQALQFVSEKAGLGADQLNVALQKVPKAVGDAAAGLKQAGYVFEALNLNAKDLLTLSPDQQFQKISEALMKIPNHGERARLAMKLFGDEVGTSIIKVMEDAATSLGETEAMLTKMGVTISRVDAAKIEMANDAISDLKTVSEGVTNQLAIQFAPVIKGIAELLKNAAGETGGFRDQIGTLVTWGVRGVGYLADAWRGWELIIKGGRVVFAGLLEFVLAVVTKIGQAFEWMVEKVVNGVNGIIHAYNAVATKISDNLALGEITFGGIGFVDTMEQWTDAAHQARVELTDEMMAVVDQPLPHTAVENWLAETRAKTEVAAQEIAAAVQPTFDQIDVLPIKEDVIKVKKEKLSAMARELTREFDPYAESLRSIQDQIGDLVRGTKSWNEALTEVAATFVTTVLNSLVQVAAQWVANQLMMSASTEAMNKASAQRSAASATAAAGEVSAAWIPAAIAASIATMGSAAWAGMGSYLAATAIGTAGAIAIGALGNMAQGALGVAGARARGGPVEGGSLYQINEREPEFFRPDGGGEVIPLSKMSPMTEGGSGPVIINQTFTGGVTREDLGRELERNKKETLAAVVEGVSRGGSFRKGVQR